MLPRWVAGWLTNPLPHPLFFVIFLTYENIQKKTSVAGPSDIYFLSDDFIVYSHWIEMAGITHYCPDLWVLVNLLRILFIAVYVKPDSGSRAACTTETENNPRTIREDDPETLREWEKDTGEMMVNGNG